MKTAEKLSRCALAGLLAVFVCVNPLAMPADAEELPEGEETTVSEPMPEATDPVDEAAEEPVAVVESTADQASDTQEAVETETLDQMVPEVTDAAAQAVAATALQSDEAPVAVAQADTLAADATATDGTTFNVSTFMELRDAFKYDINAQSGQSFTINLTDDIVLESPAAKYRDEAAHKYVFTMDTHGKRYTQTTDMFVVKNGNTVTILGNGHSLIYNDNSTNNTGLGAAGSTLVLGSADGSDSLAIAFQGSDHQTAPLLSVTANGTATINPGVTLSNNVNATLFPGGAVSIQTGGTLVMNGGVIEGSTNPTFPMGGAVSIDGGTFHMNGGTIKGNALADVNDISGMGGGVAVGSFANSNASTFTMSGDAIIEGNSAALGGGVYVGKAGTFTMSGSASIKNNTARQYGGGVYVEKGGSFTMGEDNVIMGNSAQDGGGVLNFGTAVVSNVYDNDASNSGADIYNGGTITLENVKDSWSLSKEQSTSDPSYTTGSEGGTPVDNGGAEKSPIVFQSLAATPMANTGTTTASSKAIDGWYYDGHRETGETDDAGNAVVERNRWNANEDTADVPQYLQSYAVTGQPTTETMGLKAAHGATTSDIPETITVTWEDADGTQLFQLIKVDKEHVPAADEYEALSGHDDPEKAADAEDTYEFEGWDREVEPNGDVVYIAEYLATPRTTDDPEPEPRTTDETPTPDEPEKPATSTPSTTTPSSTAHTTTTHTSTTPVATIAQTGDENGILLVAAGSALALAALALGLASLKLRAARAQQR